MPLPVGGQGRHGQLPEQHQFTVCGFGSWWRGARSPRHTVPVTSPGRMRPIPLSFSPCKGNTLPFPPPQLLPCTHTHARTLAHAHAPPLRPPQVRRRLSTRRSTPSAPGPTCTPARPCIGWWSRGLGLGSGLAKAPSLQRCAIPWWRAPTVTLSQAECGRLACTSLAIEELLPFPATAAADGGGAQGAQPPEGPSERLPGPHGPATRTGKCMFSPPPTCLGP